VPVIGPDALTPDEMAATISEVLRAGLDDGVASIGNAPTTFRRFCAETLAPAVRAAG
jgi:hypothetical protein